MRIYKTRSIAADACKKGRVTMKGVELKPSRTFKIGDKFSVRKGPITYSQLELLELAKIAGQSGRDRGTGRPTKKDRREIEVFLSDDYDAYLDDFDDEE